MKKGLTLGITIVSAIFIGVTFCETHTASAEVLNSESLNTQKIFGKNSTNESVDGDKMDDSNSIILDYGKTDSNGQITHVVNNRFISNGEVQPKRLLTTIQITRSPYAQVWKFTSNGSMVKDNHALAYGTQWAAYVNTDSGFWQVASNEFIHVADAKWIG